MTLSDVMNEDKEIYYYSVIDNTGEHEHTTDREGHVMRHFRMGVGLYCWKY